jgi:hypothetical protein
MRVVFVVLLAANLLLLAYLLGQEPLRVTELRPDWPRSQGDLRLLDEIPDEFRPRQE